MAGSGPPNDEDGYSYRGSRFGENGDEQFTEDPSPWYLKPWALALWGVAVVALIATIVWGLVELANDNRGGGPASTPPSTTRPSSTMTPSPTTTTTPTTTSETTTTSVPPESSEPPAPPTTNQTWTQRPRRHWWNGTLPNMPNLPHVPGHAP